MSEHEQHDEVGRVAMDTAHEPAEGARRQIGEGMPRRLHTRRIPDEHQHAGERGEDEHGVGRRAEVREWIQFAREPALQPGVQPRGEPVAGGEDTRGAHRRHRRLRTGRIRRRPQRVGEQLAINVRVLVGRRHEFR